ncbi:adhesin [Thioploca ingrica]|uniref:Adhesin n=1 Tax=Thioploca ingrica TaxID=40754 RepID=A0A090BW98_9GAMM|nr:adhesin [Thioploca ingrica]
MIKHFFSRWLIFIFFILSLLTACGGGDEPSNMLTSTYRPPVSTTPTTPTNETLPIQFRIIDQQSNQQLIPSGGRTTIKRTAVYAAEPKDTGEIAPLIPLNISLHPPGAAKLEDAPKFTDKDGNLIFTVSDPGSENITVNISGRDTAQRGFDIQLYFGATATADVIQSTSTANGSIPTIIRVVAHDWKGAPIRGIPVELAFPPNSSATTYPLSSDDSSCTHNTGLDMKSDPDYFLKVPATVIAPTTSTGELCIGIVDMVPETLKVTPIVGGLTIGTYSLDFRTGTIATGEAITPEIIVKSNNVSADGVTTAKLIVLARNDVTKSPIPNVPIRIYSDSITAQLKIGGELQTFSITGNTGASGYIELTVTDTIAETVNLTAVTTSGETVANATQAIIFTTGESATGIKPTTITLDKPIPEKAEANGQSSISLVGQITSKISAEATEEVPVADFPVSILVSGGSAKMTIANDGKTNEAGFFVVTFTDTVVEQFTARAVAGTVSSSSEKIEFTAVAAQPTVPGETPTVVVVPATVTLIASPPTQIADGTAKITLVARVRDNRNIPLKDAQVEITADSDTSPIIFDKTQQATDAGGSATFTATSTAVGEFTVTVQAWVVDKNNQLVGSPVRNSRSITFVSADTPVTNLNIESITDDYQKATGKDAIKVKVSAKNDRGQPVKNAPIVVQLSAGEETKAIPAKGFTGDDGSFETAITSTRAGKVGVSFAVEQTSVTTSPTTINFVATDSTVPGGGPPVSQIDLKVENNNQPADGQSKITLIVIPRDAQNTPLFGKEVVLFTNAQQEIGFDNAAGKTNELGEFRTTITSAKPQSFQVTAALKGQTAPITTQTLTFVAPAPATSAVIDFQILNDNQPANNESESILVVTVKAANGTPVKDAAVKFLADDPNLKIGEGKTNEIGEFRVAVKHNVPGTFRIIPVVDTIPGTPKYITFTPLAGAVIPASIQLEVIGDAQKPADGQAAINLRAVVFDNQGKPLPGVDMELVSNSTNAKIAAATGKTNSLGEFLTTVTDAVAETVNITPIAKDAKGTQVTGAPVALTFVAIGLEVADLSVTVIDNNQDANGKDPVVIQVIARDSGGRAVPNVPIVVQMPTGTSAVAKVDDQQKKDAQGQVVTDDTGVFKVGITSRQAGDVHVSISVKDTEIAHPPVTVTFKPSSDSAAFPSTVELLAVDSPQPANGKSKITLVVIPRDASGNPLPGKSVSLIADSDKVTIAAATDSKTNALGEFRTTVTTTEDMTDSLTEILTVNITPVSEGVVGEPTPVVFTPVSVPIPATLTLTADKNSVEISTDQENFATLTVLTRDGDGSPMPKVPVKLLVSPSDKGNDITGSTIFDKFKGNTDDATGTFVAKVKNSLPGTVKVTAVALSKTDGEPILNSNTIEIVFKPAATSNVKEVSSLDLIATSFQLSSASPTEGVIITAIVKDEHNNLVDGATVSFETSSGEIQPIQIVTAGQTTTQAVAGKTDASGRAQARLTTLGNPDNRTITVRATVPTATGEIREDTIEIEVTGSKVGISGPSAVIANTDANFVITVTNSAGSGIANKAVTLTSDLGNTFDPPSPTTNTLGQASVKLIATHAGKDTITASASGADSATFKLTISDSNFIVEPTGNNPLCTSIADYEDTNNNRILDPGEDLNNNGILDLGCRISLQATAGQQFKVHWDEGGINQVNEKLLLSTTRGQLDSNQVITDLINGNATFTVRPSGNAGSAIITIQSEKPGGPSQQLTLRFVATNPKFINVQANPAVIGVNPVGTETQQSKILAVVRDADNNLVAGQQVEFLLTDISGGRITQGSAITDDFGRTSTTYIAGPSTSAANGVAIRAVVTGTDIAEVVNLTVAKQSLFVTLGSGNVILKEEGIRYKVPFTALVTDSNGTPISDAEVILSIYPSRYAKGTAGLNADKKVTLDAIGCDNEDINRNGLLDIGEEKNGNNQLDPGNVITVDNLTIKTGTNGYADFNVVYAIQYAWWVEAEIMARVSVGGSESSDTLFFTTTCLATDVPDNCPLPSPFGKDKACDNTK